MPYYIHPKTDSPTSIDDALTNGYPDFTTRETAFASVKSDGLQSTHTIVFFASQGELSAWRYRERNRLRDGTYVRTPWEDAGHCAYPDHFCHMSVDKPGMVSYTESVEKGLQDRQTRVRPGKYLETFYKPDDRMTDSEIARFVARCALYADSKGLQIADTAEDVVKVYIGGPSSCMDGDHFENMRVDQHPAMVYSKPGDLAVAYFGEIDSASQRCVVWPDKKVYSRIYGTGPLSMQLNAAGYTAGDLDGAHIRLIRCDRGILMPYIDNVDAASVVSGRSKIRLGSGPISTSETTGYWNEDDCDDCDREDEYDTFNCDHCGNDFFSHDSESGDYCQSCYDDYYTCDHCNRGRFDSATDVNNEQWCETCVENETATCETDTCDNTWIDDAEFTSQEIATRAKHNVSGLCRTCAEAMIYCDTCEAVYSTEETDTCPTCNRYPRCAHTLDLLTADKVARLMMFPYQRDTTDKEIEPQSTDTGYAPAESCCYPHVYDNPTVCDGCHGDSNVCPLTRGRTMPTYEDAVTVSVRYRGEETLTTCV